MDNLHRMYVILAAMVVVWFFSRLSGYDLEHEKRDLWLVYLGAIGITLFVAFVFFLRIILDYI